MSIPGRYMSPYKVKQWVADMRRHLAANKDIEIAIYAGIRPSLFWNIVAEGCDRETAEKCKAALTRAINDPSLRPAGDTPERAFNPLRYAHVTRLLEMHRTTPVSERVFGRACTKEERAAFLRRSKRGG